MTTDTQAAALDAAMAHAESLRAAVATGFFKLEHESDNEHIIALSGEVLRLRSESQQAALRALTSDAEKLGLYDTDGLRAAKLESIISGHKINEDDADWLRALAATHQPAGDEISQQADAWRAVASLLTALDPGWLTHQGSGQANAIASIRRLTQQPTEDHVPATPEQEAEVDDSLGLFTLPPIRVGLALGRKLKADAEAKGVILQAHVRDILATKQPAPSAPGQPSAAVVSLGPWYDGAPPFPQDQEWFIAETSRGDRVVLRSMDEGREHKGNYAFKTADDTYMKAELVKRWMQFPDCAYLPPDHGLQARFSTKLDAPHQAVEVALHPAGAVLLSRDGRIVGFRPRVRMFFGAVLDDDAYKFDADDLAKADRDFAGLAPHSTALIYSAQPSGEVVVTKNAEGVIVAVSRQDEDGRVLSVIAGPSPVDHAIDAAACEALAQKGWQCTECPACGSSTARGYPRPPEHDTEAALSIVTGMFVGILTEYMSRCGHAPKLDIRINGGNMRDITVHAIQASPPPQAGQQAQGEA